MGSQMLLAKQNAFNDSIHMLLIIFPKETQYTLTPLNSNNSVCRSIFV